MEPVDALFKEYEALRREVADTITHRTQIIAFSLGTIGAFFAGTFLVDVPTKIPNLVIAMFSAAIPITCLFALYLWLVEIERMYRAGDHLASLEKSINEILGAEVLTWDTRRLEARARQEARHHFRHWYYLVIGFFASIATAAPFVGLSTTKRGLGDFWWAWTFTVVAVVSAGFHVAKRLHDARTGRRAEFTGAG